MKNKLIPDFYHLIFYSSLLLSMLVSSLSFSQTIHGVVIQGTAADIPAANGIESVNQDLNLLLSAYQVSSYSKAYLKAKSQKAQNCFRIILHTAIDDDYRKLAIDLQNMLYEEVLLEELASTLSCNNPVECNDPGVPLPTLVGGYSHCNNPVEYNDPCVQGDPGHYITNSNLPCAWEITHGDPNIIVAVVDQYMDYSHTDLTDKIVSIWNKVTSANPTGEPIPAYAICNHGFLTSGAIAGIVNNGICVAGSGYDTKVAFYAVPQLWPGFPLSCDQFITEAVEQAYYDGNKTINVSWSTLGVLTSMVQEMIDNGVTIIHLTGWTSHSASYANIPGVIGVGQVNKDLNYEPYPYGTSKWDLYVDIYAPCINVCRLEHGNSCAVNSGNTSFGSAVVAGIVALIKSVNANLCPSEIERILEESNQGLPHNNGTLDPISPGNLLWPDMTQGIIDAEAAVIMAQNYGKFTINTPTVWTTDRFVSELTIEPGGELTILNANISMGDHAAVIVKRNARLILDNSSMFNCGAPWSGIKVWGNSTKAQPGKYAPLTDPAQCGIVVLRNNSTLKGAKTGISTTAPGLPWPQASEYYGGLVFCDNSDFINCRKGVEFMVYPDPLLGLNISNTSEFSECRFEEESDNVDGSEGVTIWDTDGIKFTKCHFYNLDSDGIVVYDAFASIVDANQFYDNNRGIASIATYPYSTHLEVGKLGITPNEFSGNKIHIDATASNKLGGLKIINNEFLGGEKGVYLEGPCNYFVEFNSFNSQPIGVTAVNTGIMNVFQDNSVLCNTFFCGIGNYFGGENRRVQLWSNTFQQNGSDIIVSEIASQMGAIRELQGTVGKPAGNCFSSPVAIADIATLGNTLLFRYYYRQESTCDEEPNSLGNYLKIQTSGTPPICEDLDGEGFTVPPTREDLTNVRSVVLAYAQQLNANPDNESALNALLDAQTRKERILKYLLDIALTAGDNTEAETLLTGENTDAGTQAVYGLKVNRGAYNEAKTMLSQMPASTQDEIWFKQVQEINIARLENGTNFSLTPAQTALLDLVANSESTVRVYAQGILTLLTGQRFERNVNVQSRKEQLNPGILIQPENLMSITPNPTKDQIQIELNNIAPENSNLSIIDQYGRIVYAQDISFLKSITIGLANQPDGIYFATVTLANGKMQQLRIVVSH